MPRKKDPADLGPKKPGPKPRIPIDQWEPVGHDDIARVLGLTPRWVTTLVEQGVITRTGRGQYNLVNCVHGYIHSLKDDNKNKTKTESARALNEAKARLVDAQVEEKTGEIRSAIRDEVSSMVMEMIGALLADLHAIPARVTRDMDFRKKIEDELERVQRAAYERVERQAFGDADGSDSAEAEGETIN